ncbi:MAG: C25 family cysteine peptidase, partial [Bacteroidota bacterium]
VTIRTAREELYDELIDADSSVSQPIQPIDYSATGNGFDDVTFYIPSFVKWYYYEGAAFPYHKISPYRRGITTMIDPALAFSPSLPRRTSVKEGPAGAPEFAYGMVVHEYDSVNTISLVDYSIAGTSFLGEMIGSGNVPLPQSRTFDLRLDHAATFGTVWIHIHTGHIRNGDFQNPNFGKWFVMIGRDTVYQDSMQLWYGAPLAEPEATIGVPASVINGGLLRITIGEEIYDQRPTFLDFIEVFYPQQPMIDDQPIDCWTNDMSADSALWIGKGKSDLPPLCLDVTHQDKPVVVEPRRVGDFWVIQDSAVIDSTPKHYYIVGREQIRECDGLTLDHYRDMTMARPPGHLLVITTRELEKVVADRMHDRYPDNDTAASITTVDDIFKTYSAGNLDPLAIRGFVKQQAGTPLNRDLHLLLVGDASGDYKDIAGYGSQGVITYEYDGYDGNIESSLATDDFFVQLEGPYQPPDLPVGRLPARTPAEASMMLSDATAYSALKGGPWLARSILAADDNYPDYSTTFSATGNAEQMVQELLPPNIIPRKVYLPLYEGRMEEARANLKWEWGHGARVIFWDGHGNPDVWAHERLFDSRIPLAIGQAFPPMVVALACNFGYHDDPRIECGAERLLRESQDRPAAIITNTRIFLTYKSQALQSILVREMHGSDSGGMTLGQVLLRAKQGDSGDEYPETMLFGDPTLPLRIPTSDIAITHANGQPLQGDDDIIVREGGLTISGMMIGASGKTRSGKVSVTLY